MGNASGIFNLMRNLGGSIGISISTIFLARMTQIHQANLVGHLTPYDPIFRERLSGITAGLHTYSAGPDARQQVFGVLYGILQQQSNLNAYVDLFYWTALVIAVCLPGAWLLNKFATKGSLALH